MTMTFTLLLILLKHLFFFFHKKKTRHVYLIYNYCDPDLKINGKSEERVRIKFLIKIYFAKFPLILFLKYINVPLKHAKNLIYYYCFLLNRKILN